MVFRRFLAFIFTGASRIPGTMHAQQGRKSIISVFMRTTDRPGKPEECLRSRKGKLSGGGGELVGL
jgi:hypothetical protein